MGFEGLLPRFFAQLIGYLIGSIPCGYLVARWKAGIDIRTQGSGNIGATNVGRVLGFRYFLLVFALDYFKGFLPVAAAYYWQERQTRGLDPSDPAFLSCLYIPELVGFAVILGHMLPVYLLFKGGKGVAASVGVMSLLTPWPALITFLVWLAMVLLTRTVSAGSIAGAFAYLTSYILLAEQPFTIRSAALTIFVFAVSILVAVRHWQNVVRILAGTEPQIELPWTKERAEPSNTACHPTAATAAEGSTGSELATHPPSADNT